MTTTRILFVAMALVASPALAAQGLPQMDSASFPGQLAWLAISFVLLYFLVSAFIAPRISSVLDQRERTINEAIATAERLKEKAEGKRGNFEAAGTDARAKAAALVAQAQADAAKAASEAQATLHAELEAKAQESRARIARAVTKANGELDSAAQSLAAAMSEKLLSNKPAASKTTKKAS